MLLAAMSLTRSHGQPSLRHQCDGQGARNLRYLHFYAAIKTGNVGLSGSTGTLLFHTLEELRSLADRTLPEIRQAYLSSSVPPP